MLIFSSLLVPPSRFAVNITIYLLGFGRNEVRSAREAFSAWQSGLVGRTHAANDRRDASNFVWQLAPIEEVARAAGRPLSNNRRRLRLRPVGGFGNQINVNR